MAAGPIANFILAIVIFAVIFVIYGKPSTPARVDTVQPGTALRELRASSPAIWSSTIDGDAIDSFSDMQRIVIDERRRTAAYSRSSVAARR